MIPLKQVPRGFWPVFIALLQGIAAALPAQAAVVTDTEELIGLSLEELLQVQVTTLS